MPDTSYKFLDIDGLSRFWNDIKGYINNKMAVTSGTINTRVRWKKQGNVVTVFVKTGDGNLTQVNQWVALGTLPDQCKPKDYAVTFMCFDNNAGASTMSNIPMEGRINTDGVVAVYPFVTGQMPRGTVTFVVD